MHASVVLTVAQSKRLIAKAVARMPVVKRALAEGMVAIGRGTTNGYVAEEILGHTLLKGEYVAGRTLPPGMPAERLGSGKLPDIVLKRGKQLEGTNIAKAIDQMGPGDVFIKGANALNYTQQVAGVLIGHPTGGTTGAHYGAIIARKIELIIPIGLEKLVYADINELSRLSRSPQSHPDAPVVPLYPITGTIVTEIEAFALLCDVTAYLQSAGGVGGAEGAVWLLLEGTEEHLKSALMLCHSLQAEPNLPLQSG